MKQKTIEDYGIHIGSLKKGELNKITDVKGVRVGHCTIDNNEHKTGVTVVMPSKDNIFLNKLPCAVSVINGFGKTIGTVQVEELGTLETPIAITNTLNVGLVHDSMVEYMIRLCKEDNCEFSSINPVVCECNDGYLNKITDRAVKQEHVFKAIEDACEDFLQGDIGAGKGTSCHNLKGGIGSASRIIELDGKEYTVGMLVQSNYGRLEDLTIDGNNIGKELRKKIDINATVDKGSIIMIIATDIPLSDRQLKRAAKRASVGLARVGSYIGHGSGDIVICFSTANAIKHEESNDIITFSAINEDKIDSVFRAVAECCEESILNSMICSNTVIGYKGNIRYSLEEVKKLL